MASKSKKRRRVFRASCILAALIIAGSSFAWFTSKDEVTNRLTANADYGVSIVESFVPPKNWLPGQEINKDVYAVNTGSVDAFVKETITGVLNYTYEQAIDTWDAGCVELTPERVTAIDGATTEEAGGFLAWTSADYPTGPVNSARQQENPAVEGRWTPPAEGVYIFRRSITNPQSAVPAGEGYDPDFETNHPDATQEEIDANAALAPKDAVAGSFTYAGYYFKDGKYYEIVIGDDSFPTDGTEDETASTDPGYAAWNFDVNVDSNHLGAGVTSIDADGVITGSPRIRYVKEYKVENAEATFVYDNGAGTEAPATLTAVYTPDIASTGNVATAEQALADAEQALSDAEDALAAVQALALQDDAAVANAEADYEDALGNYNSKKSRYDQTKADYEYAKKLADATNALYDAADARAIFQAKLNAAETAKDEAWEAVNDKANELLSMEDPNNTPDNPDDDTLTGTYADIIKMKDDNSAISYASLFQTGTNTLEARINELNTDYPGRFKNIKDNMDAMAAKWTAIKNLLNGTTTPTATTGILADLDTLSKATPQLSAAQAAVVRQRLATNMKALKDRLNEYKNLYAAMQREAATETMLTELGEADPATVNDTATLAATFYDTGFKANPGGLEKLLEDYESKWTTWNTMNTTGKDQADAAWRTAVDTYNTAVTKAETNANPAEGDTQGYIQDVGTKQNELNDFNRLQGTAPNRTLKNQAELIVPDYAAEGHIAPETGNPDNNPRIAVTTTDPATYPAYTTYTGTATLKTGSTTEYEVTAENGKKTRKDTGDEKDFTQLGITVADHEFVNPEVVNDNGTPDDTTDDTTSYTALTLEQLLNAANEAKKAVYGEGGTAENVTGGKLKDYNDAKTARSGREAQVTAAQNAVTTATSNVTTAQEDVITALGKGSPVKIIINLADDETGLGWTPGLADEATSTAPEFYLNKVLKAGETSAKLIDSVRLDENTKPTAYKSLVFDLNVGMDSVQVTYDANQRDYATDAVTPENGFNMTAHTTAGSDVVSWT